MRNFLIAFIVFILWSIFGLWVYSWTQSNDFAVKSDTVVLKEKKVNEQKKEIEKVNIQKIDTISKAQKSTDTIVDRTPQSTLKAINQKGEIIFLFSEGMTINKNSKEVFIPNTILDFKYKLNTYLIEHPNQELHIISLYSPSENIERPNLGIQRGDKLKEILINTGIESEKIVVKPIIKDLAFNNNNEISNTISFLFKPLNLTRIQNIKLNKPESKIIYPKFSNSVILANDELKNLLAEIKTTIKNHPTIEIEIVGHTDNIGNSSDNYATGLKNANQVRWYLISKGNLDRKQIKATSKGEMEPIDTNNSHQGRIANKRIEVIFI